MPTANTRLPVTHVRYVIMPGNLAHITHMSSGRRIVANAAFFRKIASLSPRAVLGTAEVTDAQLNVIGFTPVQRSTAIRKEVSVDDARISFVS